jgi:hypothetical protein
VSAPRTLPTLAGSVTSPMAVSPEPEEEDMWNSTPAMD